MQIIFENSVHISHEIHRTCIANTELFHAVCRSSCSVLRASFKTYNLLTIRVEKTRVFQRYSGWYIQ